MAKTTAGNKPSLLWILFGVLLTLVFILVQVPPSWLVARFAPEQTILSSITGKFYEGQAQFRLDASNVPLQGNGQSIEGTLKWQLQPLELLTGNLGAAVQITTGASKLSSDVSLASDEIHISQLQGKLTADVIEKIAPVELADAQIFLQDITLHRTFSDEDNVWQKANGKIRYSGGQYRVRMRGVKSGGMLPAMLINLVTINEDNKPSTLHVAITNSDKKRLGDVFFDTKNMIDVRFTQRLLQNIDGYSGNADLDTDVVSIKQPLKF